MGRFAFMIAYYGASAVYQGYIALFYGGIGLNKSQIGGVNAAAAISALLAQPLWGTLGDRVKRRTRLLCLLSVLAAIVLPSFLLGKQFLWQMAVSFAFYAFFSALLPLGDAVILSSAGKESYGKARLAGGLGYAAFSLVGGWIIGKTDVKLGLWMISALLGCAAVSALFLSDAPRGKKGKGSIFLALKDKNLRALLLFMLPAQIAMGVYYGFFSLYFMELHGSSRFLLGAGNLIAALAEIPYLIFSDRLFEKFSAGRVMMVSTAAMCLRFLLLGTSEKLWIAMASQLLNGCGYIAVAVSMAKCMAKYLPEENAAGGQALISLMFYGAARLMGSLVGGFISERAGLASAFLVVSALCGFGLVAFFVSMFRRKRCI